MRETLGLEKTTRKTSEVFEAHCVDSWCLAHDVVGGHKKPENTRLLCVVPLRFHRRQLHYLKPSAGGMRKLYGGTRSHGMRRGSLVKHQKYGITYIGGCTSSLVSLHSKIDGVRVTQTARSVDVQHLSYNAFRTYTK